MPSKTSEAGEGAVPALLQLRGISRTYGDRQALHPLDLQVAARARPRRRAGITIKDPHPQPARDGLGVGGV
ncbi:hypothetical protein ACWGCC_15310, partial [Streptomyces nigrescens]